MKRPAKRGTRTKLTAAERAVEELRAIRKALWKEAGGSYHGVVEIARREGSVKPATPRKRRSA